MANGENVEKQERIRDASGKFVKKGTSLQDTVKKTVEVSGPITVIRDIVKDPTIDRPLVSFQINNPFRKLFLWIKEIKNKQTTTFDFKVKIPLIALPVFFVVIGSAFTFFFNLGKGSANNESTKPLVSVIPSPVKQKIYQTSKVGTVKGTYQVLGLMAQAIESPTPNVTVQLQSSTPTTTPSPTATPTNTPTPTPLPSRFVLLEKDEQIIFLVASDSLKLDKYINKRVLINGTYNEDKRTLEIKKNTDIEVLL